MRHPHTALVSETLSLLKLAAKTRGVFFPNQSGMFYRRGVPCHYGVPGSPDIYGITTRGYLGLEAKTGKATQQNNQIEFERITKHYGQLYFVFHTAKEALEIVLKYVPTEVDPTVFIREKRGGIF